MGPQAQEFTEVDPRVGQRLVRDLLSEVTKSGGRGFSDAIDLAEEAGVPLEWFAVSAGALRGRR